MSEDESRFIGRMIGNKWMIKEKISSGALGSIYAAQSKGLWGNNFEVKTAGLSGMERHCLEVENEVLNAIESCEDRTILGSNGKRRFPAYKGIFIQPDGFALVSESNGRNLQTVMKDNPRLKMDYCAVAKIATQVIKSLKILHSLGYVHRDIRPDNISFEPHPSWWEFRSTKESRVRLCNFGLARNFRDAQVDDVVNEDDSTIIDLTSSLFSSIAAHDGRQHEMKDDLESLMFVVAYLCTGSLPWEIYSLSSTPNIFPRIKALKIASFKYQRLFDYFPEDFRSALEMVTNMEQGQTPDYDALIGEFKKVHASLQDSETTRYRQNYDTI